MSWSRTPQRSSNTQAIVRALVHLLEQHPITILLRTPHTPAAGHRLMSNRGAASCWLAFILREFAMQENKFLLLPNTGCFMLNPDMPVQQEHCFDKVIDYFQTGRSLFHRREFHVWSCTLVDNPWLGEVTGPRPAVTAVLLRGHVGKLRMFMFIPVDVDCCQHWSKKKSFFLQMSPAHKETDN